MALRAGRVETLPVKVRKTKVQERRLAYIYIRCKNETAIRRRPAGDIWQGLWEPVLMENGQWTMDSGEMVLIAKDVKHVLTHRVLYADFYFMEATKKPSLPEGYIWVRESALDDYAKPRLIEKLLDLLLSSRLFTPLSV